jgi:hypothetical protein
MPPITGARNIRRKQRKSPPLKRKRVPKRKRKLNPLLPEEVIKADILGRLDIWI